MPSWNCSAVHVKGIVKISSKEDTAQLVRNMSAKYAADLLEKHDIMSPEIIDKLSGAIIGLSIEISEIQAKFKRGQHSKIDDQQACPTYYRTVSTTMPCN
ncbi:FMN-binding negative transcriptional regulator [Shewanella sp.]|uniref:FMN-binding negative transcriptional regulator n=1 Tax=Shewanella sp. TaxID=50422 RepID=UPI0025D87CCD|nr:FMN-binding negative transcriptional regulator [Shewanella sp.]